MPYAAWFLAINLSSETSLHYSDDQKNSQQCHAQWTQETLTDLRSRFWVVKGRQTVRKVTSSCATCKKLDGKPYSAPPQPTLPGFRVSDEMAFTQVGFDFVIPVYLKDVYSKSRKV